MSASNKAMLTSFAIAVVAAVVVQVVVARSPQAQKLIEG